MRVTFAGKFWSAYLFLLAVVLLLALNACGHTPVKSAQTADQKAFALYGTFVVYEEVGAKLVQSAEVPASVKAVMRTADATAKPIADKLLDASLEVIQIQREIAAGASTQDKLAIANANLARWYQEAEPKIAALVSAVKEK